MSVLTRSKISQIVVDISNVQSKATLVNDCIQIALNRAYQFHDWPYFLVDGHFNTWATYETGTIAITQYATTATITTGVVTSDFVEAKIRIGTDRAWYRISSVNTVANTITLDAQYSESTVTAATYVIFNDEFALAPDLDKYKTLRQFQNGIPMMDVTPQSLDIAYPVPQNYADPVINAMVGSTQYQYTTGTLSGTGTTITGAGTEWASDVHLTQLGNMSLIRVGSNVYTIKSVDSDTQITTYENVGTIAALSTYTIMMNNLMVQLYQIPNALRTIRYRYFRIPNPLANDYDVPDMPHEFHHLLIWGALSEVLSQKGDINKSYQIYEARFNEGLNLMKMKIGTFAPNRITVRRSTGTSRTRRLDGLETSNFSSRYSS